MLADWALAGLVKIPTTGSGQIRFSNGSEDSSGTATSTRRTCVQLPGRGNHVLMIDGLTHWESGMYDSCADVFALAGLRFQKWHARDVPARVVVGANPWGRRAATG